MASDTLTPYRIDVPQAELDELQRRLDAARLPEELPDAAWSDGMLPSALHVLLDRWRSGFDWRAVEASLNRYPQVFTDIDGTGIHALDVRAADSGDRPALLLLHGWPSSIAEFRKLIDPLTNPEEPGAPAFDVVVPSMPGYGFSGPTHERGWSAARMADALDELMRRLGHDRYIAHGGDVGYQVATELGRRHGDRAVGMHLDLGGIVLAGEHRSEEPENEEQRIAFERFDHYIANGSAYASLHATRPQTLSYALTDSPVGQLAWIAEKFHEWPDPNYEIETDDVLTAASIYWFTKTAGSSARFYQENYGKWSRATEVIPVPTVIASFPGDIVAPVQDWAREKFQIHRWVDMPDGGHFAALETPHHLIDSLRRFGTEIS